MSGYFAFFLPALLHYGSFLALRADGPGRACVVATAATAGFIFIGIPLLDALASGVVRHRPHPRQERAIVLLSLPVQVLNVFFFAWAVTTLPLGPVETAAGVVLAGILFALYGQNPAHELIHRDTRLERWTGLLLFSTSLYTGARLAHVHSHHRLVATPMDPTSARRGQSLYAYLPGAVAVNLFGWWGPRGHPAARASGQNLAGYGLSLGWALAVHGLFGPRALGCFVVEACIGILVLEIMNYIGHYGLVRAVGADGRPEPVAAWHAWDCDLPFSNLVLIGVQRHADHHLHPARPYAELRCPDASPRLPLSYPLLFLAAMVPPLWRRVIHPRLARQGDRRPVA